jgi:hypothetical protein
MTLPIHPEMTHSMGRSFVIQPSVRKASTLVGEGGFEQCCLGMMTILVIGYEDIECGGSCEDMEKFVGLGLNQGSKQWGILSRFLKCARKTN